MMLGGGRGRGHSNQVDGAGLIAILLLIFALPIWIVRIFFAVIGLAKIGGKSWSSNPAPVVPAPRRKISFASVGILLVVGAVGYFVLKQTLVGSIQPVTTKPATSATLATLAAQSPQESDAVDDQRPAIVDAAPLTRVWTDSTGKFHTEAELADYQNRHAYLKEANGRIVSVALDRLSEADRAFISSTVPVPTVLVCNVVTVTDGDTLNVHDDEHGFFRIRLEGIDAPERDQAFGSEAKDALSAKVLGKEVVIECHGIDTHGRTLGQIFCDGHWINQELVQNGMAWHYRQYSKSAVLEADEVRAREAHRGLWQDEHPDAPWDHRKPPAGQASVALEQSETRQTAPSSPIAAATSPEEQHDTGSDTSRISPGRISSSRAGALTVHDSNGYTDGATGHTATGLPIYTGPRGGQYHYSKSGKKVYERKKH